MKEENKRFKYAKAIELARGLLKENPSLSLRDLRRGLRCSHHVATIVVEELRLGAEGSPLEALRKILAEPEISNYATLCQAAGQPRWRVAKWLRVLPKEDEAVKAFRIRSRRWRRELKLEAEKVVAQRLETHLLRGGNFGTFAIQEGLSRATVGRLYSRHLGHLEYSGSRTRETAFVQKVQNVCDLARTGLSSAEIAEQLAISRDEVYSILHRYGSMDLARLRLFSKTRLIKEERAQRKAKRKIEILKLAVDVRKLCAKGYNMLEVARRLGIERTLLYYRLRKAETLYPGRFPPGTLVTEKRSRYSAPLEGLKI